MKTIAFGARSFNRDNMAALLSILPGTGHLYKHHYAAGLGILFGGNALVGLMAGLLVLGTLGLSLVLIPAAFVALVACSAYNLPDWHGHHHFLHPWTSLAKE